MSPPLILWLTNFTALIHFFLVLLLTEKAQCLPGQGSGSNSFLRELWLNQVAPFPAPPFLTTDSILSSTLPKGAVYPPYSSCDWLSKFADI
mmetsp:Transcript_46751/g.98205  ORF Transcript_46751/g.98205 Transcript_46751/m.98205 type:complete len:91 (+) Transcript_46751:333-605(+)